MKRALLLNVVDPSIGGVLIKGERGTAKSTGVRALIDLLPTINVVENCAFHCDPGDRGASALIAGKGWRPANRW